MGSTLGHKRITFLQILLLSFSFLIMIVYYSMDIVKISNQYPTNCDYKTDLIRGQHQNIIGYSLYGNWSNPEHYARYLAPMKLILQQIIELYPGWIVRIYTPLGDLESTQILIDFFQVYDQVDVCNVTSVLESLGVKQEFLFPMTWRFLPLLDSSVDRFMSRDTDSIVLKREAEAVNEWLQSPVTFHIMRDHEKHCVPILGGLWGVKIHQNRTAIRQAAQRLFQFQLRPSEMKKGVDQALLNKFIWPLAVHSLMAHDSHCCIHFPESTKPFPTQREGASYVGDIHLISNSTPTVCRERCRPKNHPDWTYC